jgi:outer membrane protein TolC
MQMKIHQYIKIWFIGLVILNAEPLAAQQSLPYYIEAAIKKSYPQLIAIKKHQQAALSFKNFQLTNKPSLSFYGNAPVFNKDNYAVTQPDGSIKFLPRSQNFSNAGIGFTQPIGATGGNLSINTDFYRFDNFTDKTTQYNGTPFFLRLQQPLFAFNAWQWDKQMAPLTLQIANKELWLQAHETTYEVCQLFFNVLEAQVNEELAQSAYANATTNLAIEKRKKQLGTSTDDKVMQIEMQQLLAIANTATALQNKQEAFVLMRTYINNTDTGIQILEWPTIYKITLPDTSKVLLAAKNNLPAYSLQQQQQLVIKKRMDEAKKKSRQVDFVASYGFNNTAANLGGIYTNPQNQQRFSIGLNIPIADWGRRKNNILAIKMEEEQLLLTQTMETITLQTEIKNIVLLLPVLQKQIALALTLDTLAAKRFEVANRLFQIGKLTLLELQTAQTEKENAKRNCLSAIRKFWENAYLLNFKTNTIFF